MTHNETIQLDCDGSSSPRKGIFFLCCMAIVGTVNFLLGPARYKRHAQLIKQSITFISVYIYRHPPLPLPRSSPC